MALKLSQRLRNIMMTSNGLNGEMTSDDMVLRIYSGSAPATADAAVTGTLLCEITKNGAANPGNSLTWDTAGIADGVMTKTSGETWQGTNAASGTAGYFRFEHDDDDQSNDTGFIHPRIQGTCATVGGDLNLASLSLTISATLTINSFSVALPNPT